MTNQFKIIALILMVFAMLSACGDEDPGMEMEMEMEMEDECEGVEPSYSNDIAAIISASCAITGCHVEGCKRQCFGNQEKSCRSTEYASFKLYRSRSY